MLCGLHAFTQGLSHSIFSPDPLRKGKKWAAQWVLVMTKVKYYISTVSQPLIHPQFPNYTFWPQDDLPAVEYKKYKKLEEIQEKVTEAQESKRTTSNWAKNKSRTNLSTYTLNKCYICSSREWLIST